MILRQCHRTSISALSVSLVQQAEPCCSVITFASFWLDIPIFLAISTKVTISSFAYNSLRSCGCSGSTRFLCVCQQRKSSRCPFCSLLISVTRSSSMPPATVSIRSIAFVPSSICILIVILSLPTSLE